MYTIKTTKMIIFAEDHVYIQLLHASERKNYSPLCDAYLKRLVALIEWPAVINLLKAKLYEFALYEIYTFIYLLSYIEHSWRFIRIL